MLPRVIFHVMSERANPASKTLEINIKKKKICSSVLCLCAVHPLQKYYNVKLLKNLNSLPSRIRAGNGIGWLSKALGDVWYLWCSNCSRDSLVLKRNQKNPLQIFPMAWAAKGICAWPLQGHATQWVRKERKGSFKLSKPMGAADCQQYAGVSPWHQALSKQLFGEETAMHWTEG